MNSKSFNNKYPDDFKCCNQAHCCPGHPLATKSILACGQGSGFAIPVSAPYPIPVASANIDTTCLCKPKIKIDFNSIINYQALITLTGTLVPILANAFTITFQLSKTCCDGSKISLGSWDYGFGSVALTTNITNSFGFSYCECNPCPGCCVYTVDIIRATGGILTPTAITLTENASIRSSILTIIASSN
ncbi:DUF4489 domain-containing protein [Clostridium ihumii]|uniref:DUF4489 domain-containing protein n=1 Tax=Clostridium ihumii TaxID=1470356 RepID=UPI003D34E7ED